MEKSLLEKALSESADYTESIRSGQIFGAKPLIRETNSRIPRRGAGAARGFAQ
jgi:hypothetical protein